MLREALDRSLLLMRDEVKPSVCDDALLAALTETRVAVIADRQNLRTHSAQSAFVTTALLLARSGHQVYLVAPNVPLFGLQPPLRAGMLIDQLDQIGRNILPGISFLIGSPSHAVDLAILIGDTIWNGQAERCIRLNATSWRARLLPAENGRRWSAGDWPIGGMGAAALGAVEAFKTAMSRFAVVARDEAWFSDFFAPTAAAFIDLAPVGTPEISNLDRFDFVSGGAITNGALYALLRLPGVKGTARIIERDIVELSNLNRGMLFLRSGLRTPKAVELARYAQPDFRIRPVRCLFQPSSYSTIGALADAVLVGVDDIPARWDVQQTWPTWLGVGATTHFSAMASFHTPELPCAGCLHPVDEPDGGRIPTIAFVSFWAGLWLASLFLRHFSGRNLTRWDQQMYFSLLRPESVWSSPVQRRPNCPVNCKHHSKEHAFS